MRLKEYLKSRNFSVKEFATLVGVSCCAIHNYMSGKRTPRLEIAQKIKEVTNEKVSINDLLILPGEKNE